MANYDSITTRILKQFKSLTSKLPTARATCHPLPLKFSSSLLLSFTHNHIISSKGMTLSEDLTTILNHIQKKRDIWHCNKIINPKCDWNLIHKSEDRKITKAIILYQKDIIPEEWWLRNVYCKYIWFSIRNMSILIRICKLQILSSNCNTLLRNEHVALKDVSLNWFQ